MKFSLFSLRAEYLTIVVDLSFMEQSMDANLRQIKFSTAGCFPTKRNSNEMADEDNCVSEIHYSLSDPFPINLCVKFWKTSRSSNLDAGS